MGSCVIRVENLSKQYRLGLVGSTTINDDLRRWWAFLRGKEDPFLKIGEQNDRSQKGSSDYVWSLRNVNFEVEQGEVLGIIGKNGAGKSTLLKILSKVTGPTTGKVKVRGRIASLLEVGTGFHPELTGRENVFLNGAILGMRRWEIQKKFDEIVDFAGVERYIDTPVKRYSSGMYVRLAFAVAAFLEPEILIIDEVLAVGDAEFQKKCLGRMKAVSSGEGRTILFVSHNMGAVESLCQRCILLNNGEKIAEGATQQIIEQYSSVTYQRASAFSFEHHLESNKPIMISDVKFLNENGNEVKIVSSGQRITINISILNSTNQQYKNCSVGIGIFTLTDVLLVALKNDLYDKYFTFAPGINNIQCELDAFPLSKGSYKMNVIINQSAETLDWLQDMGVIEVESGSFFPTGKTPASEKQSVLVKHKWI